MIEDLKKIKEELYQLIKKQVMVFTWFVFLNVVMAVYYETDRTLFHAILQTIHLVNIVVLVMISFPTFMRVRKSNIDINIMIKKLEKHGGSN